MAEPWRFDGSASLDRTTLPFDGTAPGVQAFRRLRIVLRAARRGCRPEDGAWQ